MINIFNKKSTIKIFLISILLIVNFIISHKTNAATLSITPSSTTVSVDNIVSVKVVVNTFSKSINNAEGVIEFPTDLLEVISVNKSSSIFSLWVEEPSFSNHNGKITFNGGVPNPGFIGANGNVISITFKAKKQGTASVIFGGSAVRENDGLGTDILTSKNLSTIQIGLPKKIEIPKTTNEKNVAPVKPIIFSDTHLDQDSWYSSETASFGWKIPSGVTSIQTLLDKKPDSNPTIKNDNSVTQKTFNNLSEGISYFHLRYLNSTLGSAVSHYKIKVDFTPPLSFVPEIRLENNENIVKLNAEDEISGIDYYTLQIDNNSPIKVKKDDLKNDEYHLPYQNEGNHDLVVIAYDLASNQIESKVSFQGPVVLPPVLSLSSKEIVKGEFVIIAGKTIYTKGQVKVILEFDNKEIKSYTQNISSNGSFSITTDKIDNVGLISISAETILSDLVKSSSSEKIYLKVDETQVIKISLAVLYPLLGLVAIISLLIIILFILYLGWHKFFGLKKQINNELQNIAKEIHQNMVLLKKELSTKLETLEKIKVERYLNDEEEAIFNEIEKNISDIDKFIEERLRNLM